MRVANKAREVKVPDVSGRSVADAKRALTAVGLVLKVEMHRADAKIPADHVISQDPSAGSVLRRDRAIRVRVSDGQQDPVLPSVVGQLERSADIALAQDAVQVGVRAEIRTAAYPAGTVVAQDPRREEPCRHRSRCWSTAERPARAT